MNKSSILLATLLAVGGVAIAAEPDSTQQPNNTMGAKMKRGANDVGSSFKQMGRDAKGVAHDLTHRGERRQTNNMNTTSSGYGGDSRADMSGDSARRQRMDAAYANWQGKR